MNVRQSGQAEKQESEASAEEKTSKDQRWHALWPLLARSTLAVPHHRFPHHTSTTQAKVHGPSPPRATTNSTTAATHLASRHNPPPTCGKEEREMVCSLPLLLPVYADQTNSGVYLRPTFYRCSSRSDISTARCAVTGDVPGRFEYDGPDAGGGVLSSSRQQILTTLPISGLACRRADHGRDCAGPPVETRQTDGNDARGVLRLQLSSPLVLGERVLLGRVCPQRPVKCAGRFCRNAATPSRWSAVCIARSCSSPSRRMVVSRSPVTAVFINSFIRP